MNKDEAFEKLLDIVARFLETQDIDADDLLGMKRCGCEACIALHDMHLTMLPLIKYRSQRRQMN